MRTLDEVIASLPQREQTAIETRAEELVSAYRSAQVPEAGAPSSD